VDEFLKYFDMESIRTSVLAIQTLGIFGVTHLGSVSPAATDHFEWEEYSTEELMLADGSRVDRC